MLSPPPDRERLEDRCRALIARVAERDEAGLAALYDLTSPVVFGLSMKILRDDSDAEESTLEVYQQVWSQADRYDPTRGTPLGWLVTMTRSRAIDRLRVSQRRAASTGPLEVDVRDPGDGPAEIFMTSERRAMVRRAIQKLEPKQRQVLEAAYFRGLSQSDTARTLGWPLGTVKTRTRAAMTALRDELCGMESGR